MKRALPWVVLAGALLLVVLVGGRREDQGVPLDPGSPRPLGTKALVEVLRGLGARVSVSADPPAAGVTTGLLLAALLAPSPGVAVRVLRPPLPGAGRKGLGDLVAPRVKLAVVQLAVA